LTETDKSISISSFHAKALAELSKLQIESFGSIVLTSKAENDAQTHHGFCDAPFISNRVVNLLRFIDGLLRLDRSLQLSTAPVLVNVPIALNWKDAGIVVWLECEADAYLFEGLICGFQLKEQISWQIQKTRRFEKSIYPEVWFFRDWPAIPLREGLSGVMSWNYDGIAKHPFEAKVRRVMEQ